MKSGLALLKIEVLLRSHLTFLFVTVWNSCVGTSDIHQIANAFAD